MNSLGIENPTSSYEAIHDRTRQGKFFGFMSYAIDDATKLTFITGTSVANYQNSEQPGQLPQFDAFGDQAMFDSAQLNENQSTSAVIYNVLSLPTTRAGDIDTQLSFFSRYAGTAFHSRTSSGDLRVQRRRARTSTRQRFVNGLQGDAAYRTRRWRTRCARAFTVSGEIDAGSCTCPRSSNRSTSMANPPPMRRSP